MNQKTNWVNYRQIKQRVSIKEILEHYGLLSAMSQKKDELIGFCPFHKESKPSFHASLTQNAFQCFGCHAKGNISAIAFPSGLYFWGDLRWLLILR